MLMYGYISGVQVVYLVVYPSGYFDCDGSHVNSFQITFLKGFFGSMLLCSSRACARFNDFRSIDIPYHLSVVFGVCIQ